MTHANYPFGYCTNVHAGPTLAQAQQNLAKYATAVRTHLGTPGRLPVGLWLAEQAANSLKTETAAARFAEWLADQQLAAYTFNGFPQGDFHQAVVKHAVYEPTWENSRRRDYTISLAHILQQLGPINDLGSISTLPLGWPYRPWNDVQFQLSARHLRQVALELDAIRQSTGTEIVVAIESEPGCVLDTATDVIAFFESYLFEADNADVIRRHITVCHDVCHSGVMFEPQAEALQAYQAAGIRIGKVQVSSAVHVPWDKCDSDQQASDLQSQLSGFNEPKYLHQVSRCDTSGRLSELLEDLPQAFSQWLTTESTPPTPWRVHFHVPIFVEKFGCLETTQADIRKAVELLESERTRQVGGTNWFTGHYEVETYAWPVLPPGLAASDLASGIAQELQYFEQLLLNT